MVKIASTSVNEAVDIPRKLAKSFPVFLLLPSAIFKLTDTIALFNWLLRLYSSDFGKISAIL